MDLRDTERPRFLLFGQLGVLILMTLGLLIIRIREQIWLTLTQPINAGDYALARLDLLWFFYLAIFSSLILLHSKVIGALVKRSVSLLDGSSLTFYLVVSLIIILRLLDRIKCFVWGFDSFHWVASDTYRPQFVRMFYEFFVGRREIADEAPLLQERIHQPICDGYKMLYGVQASQVFYFASLFFLLIVANKLYENRLITIFCALVICSGDISGTNLSARDYVYVTFSGFVLATYLKTHNLIKLKNFGLLSALVFALVFAILFDLNPIPGQEVMSENLYIALYNTFFGLLFLLIVEWKNRNRPQVLVLYSVLVGASSGLLIETRLNGVLSLFIMSCLFVLIAYKSRTIPMLILPVIGFLAVLFVSLSFKFLGFEPKTSMSFWTTGSIAIALVGQGSEYENMDSVEASLVENVIGTAQNDEVARTVLTKQTHIGRNVTGLTRLTFGSLGLALKDTDLEGRSLNEVMKQLTITSIQEEPFYWLRNISLNLASYFGIPTAKTDIQWFFGVPVTYFSVSRAFFSIIALFSFGIILLLALKHRVIYSNYSVFLLFPLTYLFESLGSSVFGIPLARYARLTELYLFLFLIATNLFLFHQKKKYDQRGLV